jgi:hypothetical protein
MEMIPEEIYEKIIRHAVKAPSQLNSQPWRFEVEPGYISLLPDFSRSLSAIDPCNTNLYISLGCVLENLVLASRELGFEAIPEIRKFPLYTMVRIKIEEGGSPDPSGLFDQIGHRQVIRSKFAPVNISEVLIDKLSAESSGDGISIVPLMKKELWPQIILLIGKGMQILNNQRPYVKEQLHWIRFSEKEAMSKGDGIRSASLGLPLSGSRLGRLFITGQFAEKKQVKRWTKLINQSSGLVLFAVNENRKDQLIKLGSSMQRFVLSLSNAGIQYAHVPLPMEYILIQKQLAELCKAEGNVPLQLIRIGKGKPTPYSFRRNIVQNVSINLHG